MTANVAVKCKTIEKSLVKDGKDVRDKALEKTQVKEIRDKPLVDKRLEKPIIDKTVATEKGFVEGPGGGFPGGGGPVTDRRRRSRRGQQSGYQAGQQQAPTEPFIGQELRPDLTGSALSSEEDYSQLHNQMRSGSRDAKRLYDTKLKE
jgi:hypothetical protein